MRTPFFLLALLVCAAGALGEQECQGTLAVAGGLHTRFLAWELNTDQ